MYVIFVIIACIPSGIVGILFKDYIEKYLSSILTVALFASFHKHNFIHTFKTN